MNDFGIMNDSGSSGNSKSAGMKEDIILLHGALGSMEQLIKLSNKLKDSYNVVLFDLNGHGRNESTADFDMEIFADQLLDEMDRRNINQSHFFGYSMGGYVALQLARTNPDRVGNIVCLGTKLEWSPEIAENENKMLDFKKLQEKVPHYAETLQKRHLDWKIVLQKTGSMMRNLGDGKAMKAEDFASIHSRVLLCVGEKDAMLSIVECRKYAAMIPNASWKILENTPHPIEKVDLQLLSGEIKTFIGKRTPYRNSKIF